MSSTALPQSEDDPRREDALEELVRSEDSDVERIVRGRDDELAERDPDERPAFDENDDYDL